MSVSSNPQINNKSVNNQCIQHEVIKEKSLWNNRVISYIPVVSTFHGIVLIVKGIIDKIKGSGGNDKAEIRASYHLTSSQTIVKGCLELVPIVNIVACAIFDKIVGGKNKVPQQPQQPQQEIQPKVQLTTEWQKAQPPVNLQSEQTIQQAVQIQQPQKNELKVETSETKQQLKQELKPLSVIMEQPKVQLTTERQKAQPSLESSQQLQLKRASDETDINQVLGTNYWDFSKIKIDNAVYETIEAALTGERFKNVQVLILPKAENFTSQQQTEIVNSIKNSKLLEELVIDRYNLANSYYNDLSNVCNKFPGLKKLSLEGCSIVAKEGLFPLEGKYGKLEELNIMHLKLYDEKTGLNQYNDTISAEFRQLCNEGKFKNLKVLKIDHISRNTPVFTTLCDEKLNKPCKLPSLEKFVYDNTTPGVSMDNGRWGGILTGLDKGFIKEGLEVEFISDHKEETLVWEHSHFFNSTTKNVVTKKLESHERPKYVDIGEFNKVLEKQHKNLTHIEAATSLLHLDKDNKVIKGLLSYPCPKVEKLVFRYHGKKSGSAELNGCLGAQQVSALFFGTLFNIPTADVIKNKEASTTTWTERVDKIKTQTEELKNPDLHELKYPTTKLVYDKLIVNEVAPQIFPAVKDIEILSQADTPIPNASADCLVKYLESGKTNLRSIKMETVFSNDDAQNIADLANICNALLNGEPRQKIEKFDIKGMLHYPETTALFASVIEKGKLPNLKKPTLDGIDLKKKEKGEQSTIFKLIADGKLSNLKEFTLDGIDLEDQKEGDNSAIFKLIEGGKLSNLEELTLKDCDITEDDIESLKSAVMLGKLPKLKKFTTSYTEEGNGVYFMETDLDNIFGENREKLQSLAEINMYCGKEEGKLKNIYSWPEK